MSAFSSRVPESIGCTCYFTDPATWVTYYGAVDPGSQMEPNPVCFEHFPHAQHNEPNPILVALRTSTVSRTEWHLAVFSVEIYGGLRAWSDEAHPFHVLTVASDDHLDHADRVLERLARAEAVGVACTIAPEVGS